jgi:hypothetical protein
MYKTEVQFHLGTIDPDSIVVEKTKSSYRLRVSLKTTDYDDVAWQSASDWKETHGRVPKELELFALPYYSFKFTNDATSHFAKALKHVVILCGGKPSTF